MTYDIAVFCKNIKRLRKKLGLSMEELAKTLEVTAEHLDAMERGILPPEVSVGIVLRIYDNYGIWPSQMFEEESVL